MRIGRVFYVALAWSGMSCVEFALAQSPARGTQTKSGASSAAPQIEATLAQLMKGIVFPSANVFFAAQSENPNDVAPAKDPSLSPNPLASTYGKWQAVENASLAMAEAANLLMTPGRKCSNGLDVPMKNADWPKLVQGLRDAGMTAYKAAQTKNQDKVVDASDTVATACANCHDKYREKPNLADRCK